MSDTATTSTSSKSPSFSTTDKPKKDGSKNDKDKDDKDDRPTVSNETLEKIASDPKFGLGPPPIQTAEDAYYAYLREEIDEDELRAVVSKFGGSPFYALKSRLERPDNAYTREVPEDLYDDPTVAISSIEDRIEAVEERDQQMEEARDAEEQERDSVQPVRVVNK
jgi:hypothetical protein